MSETKHTVLMEINTGEFTGQLSRTDRGAQLVSIMRSFFYKAERRTITQKINFMLKNLDELEYIVDQLKNERGKLGGNGAAIPAQGD